MAIKIKQLSQGFLSLIVQVTQLIIQKQTAFKEWNLPEYYKPKLFIAKVNYTKQNLHIQDENVCSLSINTAVFFSQLLKYEHF